MNEPGGRMIQTSQLNPHLFVGGCPRSGTTLLQRMLDSHPQLTIANDAHFIPRVLEIHAPQCLESARRGEGIPLQPQLIAGTWDYHRFYRMGLEQNEVWQAAAGADTYQTFVGKLFAALARRKGKRLAGEKTPDYVRHIPLLLGLFPQAKFIHIVRDGRDTALSLLNWSTVDKGPGRLAYWDQDPLATAALWWRQFVLCHADGSRFASRYFYLRYEDLIDEPLLWLQRICDFLELPFDQGMAHFHEGKASHTGHGSAKSQWLPATKGLRDWRTQMPPQDQNLFSLLAGDALQLFDYALPAGPPTAEVQRRAAQALDWWNSPGTKRRVATPPVSSSVGAPCKLPSVSEADRDLMAREGALPQLAMLLEPHRLQRYLHEHAPHFRLEPNLDLRANYVRYKSGTNCLVGYIDAAGNPWGHAVAYGREAAEKLHKRVQAAARHAVPATHSLIDQEQGVVVFRFPHDPALPELAEFAAGAFFRDTKTQAKAPAFAADRYAWRILSYKPQRRCIVKIVQDGQPFAVLRLYRQEDFINTRETAKLLAGSPWYAAERLGAFERYHAVAMKWVAGQTLDAFTDRAEQLRLARSTGELLCQVHMAPHSKLRVVTIDDMMRQGRESVEQARQLVPHLAGRLDRVLSQVYAELTRVVPRITLCHGDLHARQVLVQSTGLQFLDWDAACNGPSGLDLATFAGHQWLHGQRDPQGTCQPENLISELCAGYETDIRRAPSPAVPANFEAYVAWSLLRLLPSPFRLRWACWEDHLESILRLAEQHVTTRPGMGRRPLPSLPAVAEHVRFASLAGHPLASCELLEAQDEAQVRERVLPLVQRLFPDATAWRCEPPELIHHKPDRRAIVQYAFSGKRDNGAAIRCVVLGKINFKRLELTSYNTQLCLQELSQTTIDEHSFRVATPLGVVPRWNMWLQRQLAGVRADRLIQPGSSPEVSARIGAVLADLHQLTLRPHRRHSFDNELEILAECLKSVRHVSVLRVRRLLRNCTERLNRIPATNLTGIHRDFYPAQVIYDGSVGIIDFDLFTLGAAAIDVGNFIAHLKETALREFGSPTALADHESSFREAYLAGNPQVEPDAIEVLTAVSLARHVGISQRIPSRNSWTEPILSLCETLIDKPTVPVR